ncbi:MAG: ribbon-helix-helix domain-containing protein [Pseudomonadota bacterium]
MKDNTTSNDFTSKSSLVSRNITIFGRRTSVRLEPEMWKALKDIAGRENCSIHDICSLIDYRKREGTSLTAAIRVFLMLYFKAASTEDGHQKAGHGDFDNMKSRAGVISKMNMMNGIQSNAEQSSRMVS